MDDELEAIKARRMAELQQQYGAGGGGPSAEEQQERQRQQTDMKNSILSQVLDQSARTRLNTIAVAKPEKAKMVESMLVQMARTGQIQNKLGEDQLIGLLARVSEQTQNKTTVKFDRRRMRLDDSDED
ncbi:programmed cell death protein 5 [Patella vulgata]|uniref:programmed cell death protein 5 n=1 Tax=Patella vulgata TaxID=6465 RepID=UPI00217F2DDC|nr:programmed cell death protein 5 [Patella vulgata]